MGQVKVLSRDTIYMFQPFSTVWYILSMHRLNEEDQYRDFAYISTLSEVDKDFC